MRRFIRSFQVFHFPSSVWFSCRASSAAAAAVSCPGVVSSWPVVELQVEEEQRVERRLYPPCACVSSVYTRLEIEASQLVGETTAAVNFVSCVMTQMWVSLGGIRRKDQRESITGQEESVVIDAAELEPINSAKKKLMGLYLTFLGPYSWVYFVCFCVIAAKYRRRSSLHCWVISSSSSSSTAAAAAVLRLLISNINSKCQVLAPSWKTERAAWYFQDKTVLYWSSVIKLRRACAAWIHNIFSYCTSCPAAPNTTPFSDYLLI